MTAKLQLCTFRLDGALFAVDVHQVQVVLRDVSITRVPLAPDALRGLFPWRGLIVPAIDLRLRLERRAVEAAPGEEVSIHVVLRTDDGPASLVVDELGEVLEIDAASLERPPDNLAGAARDIVRSVALLGGELVLVLDVARTLRLPAAAAHVDSAPALQRDVAGPR
jgi:purine-binding chemotaxis protein CheW